MEMSIEEVIAETNKMIRRNKSSRSHSNSRADDDGETYHDTSNALPYDTPSCNMDAIVRNAGAVSKKLDRTLAQVQQAIDAWNKRDTTNVNLPELNSLRSDLECQITTVQRQVDATDRLATTRNTDYSGLFNNQSAEMATMQNQIDEIEERINALPGVPSSAPLSGPDVDTLTADLNRLLEEYKTETQTTIDQLTTEQAETRSTVTAQSVVINGIIEQNEEFAENINNLVEQIGALQPASEGESSGLTIAQVQDYVQRALEQQRIEIDLAMQSKFDAQTQLITELSGKNTLLEENFVQLNAKFELQTEALSDLTKKVDEYIEETDLALEAHLRLYDEVNEQIATARTETGDLVEKIKACSILITDLQEARGSARGSACPSDEDDEEEYA